MPVFNAPNSGAGRLRERGHASKFTDKFHRCLGHVEGRVEEPYGVCTASIGYAGSYKAGFRNRKKKSRKD